MSTISTCDEILMDTERETVPCTDSEVLRDYLNKIGKVPLLTHEEEIELSSKAEAGDEKAAQKLAEANLRFVVHVAKRYAGRGVALRELVSAGNLGLMKAVTSYKSRSDARFAGYAIWWIKRHVLTCLMNERRVAHVPMHRLPEIARIRESRNRLRDILGREPDTSEIAHASGLDSQLVLSICSTAFGATSLETPIAQGDSTSKATLGEAIADESVPSPASECLRRDAVGGIERLLSALPPRHAGIVRAAYGIDTGLPLSNEEVGKMYKITRERVRQIQDEALRILRRIANDHDRPLTGEDMKKQQIQSGLAQVWREFMAGQRTPTTDRFRRAAR